MKIILPLIAFILFITSCAEPVDPIKLELKYKEGDKYVITTVVNTEGNEMMSFKSTEEVEFEVISIDEKEGIYNMNANLVRIKSHTKMGGDIEDYDSNKSIALMTSDELEMHEEFKNALSSKYSVSVNKSGEVVEDFQNLNEFGSTNEDKIVDMTVVQLIFPKNKVGRGDTWQNEKNNALTDQTTKTTYKIKDITDKEIIISSTAVISALSGLLAENTLRGEYILDRSTCQLIKSEQKMNLQMGGLVTYQIYRK